MIRELERASLDAGAVPLTWARSPAAAKIVNVGDALSAIIVAGMANLPVRHANFDENCERLAAVGTIGHGMRNGLVHFWGSGLDATVNPLDPQASYALPPGTEFRVHAMRGPFSAHVLRGHGVPAPDVYGDPVYFLPRLMPMRDVAKTHELGVVLHLTELDRRVPGSRPKAELLRYNIPTELEGAIRIITMYADDCLESITEKIEEICACKAILSTSLHGIVIADAYNIPATWFSFYDEGFCVVDVFDEGRRMDHRVRDLYAGLGRLKVPVYGGPRDAPTDWEAAIRSVQDRIEPTGFTARRLYNAFPGPLAVSFLADVWPLRAEILEGVRL